jgi:hypothetical protein
MALLAKRSQETSGLDLLSHRSRLNGGSSRRESFSISSTQQMHKSGDIVEWLKLINRSLIDFFSYPLQTLKAPFTLLDLIIANHQRPGSPIAISTFELLSEGSTGTIQLHYEPSSPQLVGNNQSCSLSSLTTIH